MSLPEHIRRFEAALSSANFRHDVWNLAVALKDEGVSQIDIYALFEHFLDLTSEEDPKGEDPRFDAIIDSMECICGGPWAKGGNLFPTELTEAQIEEQRKKTQ